MKTWTNPTVEELEVKMTANGGQPNDYETLGEAIEDNTGVDIFPGWNPDLPLLNDSLNKKDKTQS